MSTNSKITWTEATWNPILGCSKASPGCDHCYAITQARMRSSNPNQKIRDAYHDLVHRTPAGDLDWTGQINLLPERLTQPLRWRQPRRIFVNSMSDLFHPDVPDAFITQIFAVMAQAQHHTFQILTKRHARMRSYLRDECDCGQGHQPGEHLRALMTLAGVEGNQLHVPGVSGYLVAGRAWPLPNVWIGVSVEDQHWANIRVPHLLDTPAAVRWLSCEPLIGSIDLGHLHTKEGPVDALVGNGDHVREPDGSLTAMNNPRPLPRIDWIVVGGESGPGARPMHPDWARQLRDQTTAAGVPFHFKQWGEWGPAPWSIRLCDPAVGWQGTDDELAKAKADAEARGATHLLQPWGHLYQADHKVWSVERDPDGDYPGAIRRWGKHAAGRELDGRVWDEYPEVRHA